MPDPGFIPGFIGVGIDISIHFILDQINIALRCKKEMNSLRQLVQRIEPIMRQIQQYRLALNSEKGIRNEAPAVNEWFKKLDGLLRRASGMARDCTIARWDVIPRYKTSKRITSLISEIAQLVDMGPLIGWASVLQELEQIKEIIKSSGSSSASTSAATSQPMISSTGFFIKEPLIAGQGTALSRLEHLVIDETAVSPFSSIGVLGKGGSGKTLLLKTLFNSKVVRDFFCDGLFLWLTVSQSPSLTSLLNELSAQIAMHTKEDPDKNMSQEDLQKWVNERMQGKRFALMLDDVWDKGAELLEDLGILRLTHCSNSKVILSSRDRRALLGMRVPEKSIISMGDLDEDDSWQLFVYHAFACNYEASPANISERLAKDVCTKCGGLPLAVKAVGRAMAGITNEYEWKLAGRKLPIANNDDKEAVYHRLRLSYDALARSYGVNLQMCFLYLVVFKEDEIIRADFRVIPLWIGEGLLAGHIDPFEMGKVYVNLLADRCLIEPIDIAVDGNVVAFRMHDVVRDLAKRIAEREESFYCGEGLTTLKENECSRCTRILLNYNNLTGLPQSLGSPEIRSLMVGCNYNITELQGRLIGSMISLKVLDMSFTSLQSLPDSLGCLKQLVFLNLTKVPITTLPASLTKLVNLQILNLTGTRIRKLPSGIHKLRSLKYLSLDGCQHLQCLPNSISRLTSLQYFFVTGCHSMLWAKHSEKHGRKRAASINDLSRLTQLRCLFLANNDQDISDGTLGNLANLETLEVTLTTMAGIPHDITGMAKLRRLSLSYPQVVEVESNSFRFQYLSHLRLENCVRLEEVPQLHELKSLRQLDIMFCPRIKRFSTGFGKKGAFPLLETFSLIGLYELEQLPIIEEGSMLSLKVFTVIDCVALQILREDYLNLKTLKKIKVYGCSTVLKNLEATKRGNTRVEVVTESNEDKMTTNFYRSQDYTHVCGDFWCARL